MKKEDTYSFLLRSAIPEITEKKKLPENLRWERGKKDEKENEDGYWSKKLVWECISRAHRDVLSGRKNVEAYSKQIDKDGINIIAIDLYHKIIESEEKIQLTSESLINYFVFEKKYKIGPVQKLVNMTLKYLFILQLFGKLEEYNINEYDCHCPLDSRILDILLGTSSVKWTKDFVDDDNEDAYEKYNSIQDKITKKQGDKSRLSYDFEHWQKI